MYQSNIKNSHHNWEKQNLVTKMSRRGGYDEMICSNCGMKGRRYGFETVEVSETYKLENVNLCPKAKLAEIPEKIRITYCTAQGKQFENLTPDSIHQIVTPPENYKNDHTGVWVMGIGEPVKVLPEEFIRI